MDAVFATRRVGTDAVFANLFYESAGSSVQISATTDDAIFSGGAASATPAGSISDADVARIVSAVLAALNLTHIPVNVMKVNSINVKGSGTVNDPWNPE